MMNFYRNKDPKAFFHIGQVELVREFLEIFCIPYKDVNPIPAKSSELTESFEVRLNQEAMLKDCKNDKFISNLIKNGSIKITITI